MLFSKLDLRKIIEKAYENGLIKLWMLDGL